MFQDLENELQGVEEQQDRLGGVFTLESGVYEGIIKLAYVTPSAKSQAKCCVLVMDYAGVEVTERIWFLSGAGKPTYEKNGKTFMLPGYEMINDLCLVATGHPLTEQTVEDKTIKVWDGQERKEVEKNMPVITSILQKPVKAAVLKVRENKQEKDTVSGEYVDTNEDRTFNEHNKFFHAETGKSVVELKNKVDLPYEDLFISKWAEKNAGELRDRYKPVQGAAGAAPSGGSAGQAKPQTQSLFS